MRRNKLSTKRYLQKFSVSYPPTHFPYENVIGRQFIAFLEYQAYSGKITGVNVTDDGVTVISTSTREMPGLWFSERLGGGRKVGINYVMPLGDNEELHIFEALGS